MLVLFKQLLKIHTHPAMAVDGARAEYRAPTSYLGPDNDLPYHDVATTEKVRLGPADRIFARNMVD